MKFINMSASKVIHSLFYIVLLFAGANVAFATSVVLELGTIEGDENVERFGGAFRWAPDKKWLVSEDWYLSSYFEFGVTYWDGNKGTEDKDTLVDFSLTPVLRYQRELGEGIAPFVEFGLGAHAHTETGIGNKDLDIPFSFGTHVGAGTRFGAQGAYEIAYRFQHLSNAGLGDENPGLNFHVIQLGYHF
jgi:lipid A 3-O-deacylase